MRRRVWRICGLTVITVLFILGNWLVADGLFHNMENRLLSDDMGSLMIETTVELADVQEADSDETSAFSNAAEEKEQAFVTELTEEEKIRILTCWSNGGDVLYEPMERQLSMEAAIERAKVWMWEMIQQGSLPEILFNLISDDGEEVLFDSVVAVLVNYDEGFDDIEAREPYYSGWNVTFTCAYGGIELTLNAVTGEVWRVDMMIVGPTEKIFMTVDKEDLENFAKLAGMSTSSAAAYGTGDQESMLVSASGALFVKGGCELVDNYSSDIYSSDAFSYEKEALAYGIEVSACTVWYMLDAW